MKHIVIASLAACLAGCHSPSASDSAAPATPDRTEAAAALDPQHYDQFGAGVHAAAAVPVADVLADPEKYTGQTVRFSGPIQSVCKVKGCWMRIGGDENVFVKFQDYAFFMPLDSAGREAVVEGKIAVREIPVAEARHYLEDAGKHEEAAKITQPVREVTVMASGVALKKR